MPSSNATPETRITPFAFTTLTGTTYGVKFTLPGPSFTSGVEAAADPSIPIAIRVEIPNGRRNSGRYIILNNKVFHDSAYETSHKGYCEISCKRVYHTETMEILQDLGLTL